jgi:cysteine desulfurase/selenocysteine lyase
MKGVTLLGSYEAKNRLWVFSFASSTHHPHDIAESLADKNICVRSGHHCTEPFHAHMGLGASFRASTYIYNTKEDIDALVDALK